MESISKCTGIQTPFGPVSLGTRIRIVKVKDNSPYYPDGIDHEARSLNGKEGVVVSIDINGSLFGTWDRQGVIPSTDVFEILAN